jgi:hypothetical protein
VEVIQVSLKGNDPEQLCWQPADRTCA